MTVSCPSCQQPLRRMPKRKTRCPNCGDYLYLKYAPGESRDQKRLVGSAEAARIESEWKKREDLERDIRLAEHDRAREQAIRRLESAQWPEALVAYYVQFRPPLRDGDAIRLIDVHDRSEHWRIFVAGARLLVHLRDWSGQAPNRAPEEFLPWVLMDGSSIEYILPTINAATRGIVRIPEKQEQRLEHWPIITPAQQEIGMAAQRAETQARIDRWIEAGSPVPELSLIDRIRHRLIRLLGGRP